MQKFHCKMIEQVHLNRYLAKKLLAEEFESMTFLLARILPSLPGLNAIFMIDHFPLIGSQLATF